MIVKPLTLSQANKYIIAHHRHNKKVVGHRYSLGAYHDGELVGVVVVGRPVARNFDQYNIAEVNRLCVSDTSPRNTCSFLYNAAKRVWQAMGGERMITYTLVKESGASLRGAGWIKDEELRAQKVGFSSSKRSREYQEVYNEPKIRWDADIPQQKDR